MYSVYDLVEEYREVFCPDEKFEREDKKELVKSLKACLDKGWNAHEIIQTFRVYKRKNDELEFDISKMMRGKSATPNLLNSRRFYYHNALRLTSAAPKREIDYDSGQIICVNEPYFLEMKASFNVDDLIDYYVRHLKPETKRDTVSRYKGTFGYLLRSYNVEEILFMTDVLVNHVLSNDARKPSTPFDIEKFYNEAKEMRDKKKTEAVLSGGKKIVRKKRT